MAIKRPLQGYLSLGDSIAYASKLARRTIEAGELAKLCLDGELDVFGRLTGTVELHEGRVDDSGILYVGDLWFDMEPSPKTVGCNGAIFELVKNGFSTGLLRYVESAGELSGFDPAHSLMRNGDGYCVEGLPLDLSSGLLLRSDDGSAMFVRPSAIAYAGWVEFLAMNFCLLFDTSELARVFGSASESVEKPPRTSTQSLNKQLRVLGAMAQAMLESGTKGPSEDATLILRKLEGKGFGELVTQKTLARYLKDAYEQM